MSERRSYRYAHLERLGIEDMVGLELGSFGVECSQILLCEL